MAGVPSRLIENFNNRFPASAAPRVVRAPGRVNLIGEHTDYNLGFVAPITIELACYIAVAPAKERCIKVYSSEEDEACCWEIEKIPAATPSGNKEWTDYVLGVAQQLHLEGVELRPCVLYIESTVPVGSGLSSSAAVEVATALALMGSADVPKKRLAQLCQRAENMFVGVPSGIMDQYTSVFGAQGAALLIDCRSLTHELAPLPDGVEIAAVNTMVRHSLGASAYGERVRECLEAVEVLRQEGHEIESLRDASSADVERARYAMPDVVYRRARHVTTENERVLEFTEAAHAGDLESLGRLFGASHASLRDDYEVSCEELDFLAALAAGLPQVIGARMTGGGFGGCTVNLVRKGQMSEFEREVKRAYSERFGIDAPVYPCRPSAGAGPLFS